jgi:hypothetical protein
MLPPFLLHEVHMPVTKTTLSLSAIGGGAAMKYIQPVVTWLLNGCPSPRPDTVDTVATALVVLIALLICHTMQHSGVLPPSPSSGDEAADPAASAGATASASPGPSGGAVRLLAKILPNKGAA